MANIDAKISEMEKIVGYTFEDKWLCAEALQMAGFPGILSVGQVCQFVEKNTRLAVLGDSVMSPVLSQIWFQHRDDQGTTRTNHLVISHHNSF